MKLKMGRIKNQHKQPRMNFGIGSQRKLVDNKFVEVGVKSKFILDDDLVAKFNNRYSHINSQIYPKQQPTLLKHLKKELLHDSTEIDMLDEKVE